MNMQHLVFVLARSYSLAAISANQMSIRVFGLSNQMGHVSWHRPISIVYVSTLGLISQHENQNWHSGYRIKARASLYTWSQSS